jgi:hypothetical protein
MLAWEIKEGSKGWKGECFGEKSVEAWGRERGSAQRTERCSVWLD